MTIKDFIEKLKAFDENLEVIISAAWYDNEVQKIYSVASSLCTLKFNEVFREEVHKRILPINLGNLPIAAYNKALKMGATFDCRAFNVPKDDVCNCIIWRQQDATRNSIQALAQSVFSHKELHGLSCDKLQDKLFTERNINWNDLEIYKKRGTACYNCGEEHSDWAIDFAMPILTQDRGYINKHVFVGE